MTLWDYLGYACGFFIPWLALIAWLIMIVGPVNYQKPPNRYEPR